MLTVVKQLLLFAIVIRTSTVSVAFADQPRAKPNIVIILADDLGYGDAHCYNPERGKIPTPQLDVLASEGMRFTDAHSSSSVCSPTRYSLLTGRYHWRTWLQQGIVNKFGPPLIADDRLTIADLARQHGYRTACVGKWHLGWNWPVADDERSLLVYAPARVDASPSPEQRELWHRVFSQSLSGGPINCGFDSFFGVDLPNFPPFCFIESDRTVGVPTEFLTPKLLKNNQADVQGPAIAEWRLEPVLPTLNDRACQFIRDAAKDSKPFFLYLPLTSPHTPIAVAERWKGRSGLNPYADFVMQTDDVVGGVLEELQRAGVAAKTLVVFTSDNGCAPYIGRQCLEQLGHYPNGPWRGGKSDIWEGGHRVPFIVCWPGIVPSNSQCDQLVQQQDLMATVADILDADLSPSAGEDSVSLLPLLTNPHNSVRTTAIQQSLRGLFAVRRGPWKLVFGPDSGGWTTGRDRQPQQLYNLQEDPAETVNLFEGETEIVAELTAIMQQAVNRGRTTDGPDQQNDNMVAWRRFIGVPSSGD